MSRSSEVLPAEETDPNAPPPDSGSSASEDRDDAFAESQSGPVTLDPNVPVVFVGFDDGKLRRPLALGENGLPKSAKYTFAKLAMTSQTMPLMPRQAEDWFNTHIRDGLESKGFRVGWVRGDRALISTREHPAGELITFVRGLGEKNPAYIALCWRNEAGKAREQEVTQLSDEGGGAKDDPLRKAQAEIARQLAREEQEHEAQLQRELRDRLRFERSGKKG
ncbi:MAG: hypothetical protein IPJ65_19195 [Archangiaceae bacterium]|nr:hypothetical protein [Archangiaceae bacterium]